MAYHLAVGIYYNPLCQDLQKVGRFQARCYYIAALAVYQNLLYGGSIHCAMDDKDQIYSVEADNAELRHYLAR